MTRKHAFRLLASSAVERQPDLSQLSSTEDVVSTDEELDSQFPLFNIFYNEGGAE